MNPFKMDSREIKTLVDEAQAARLDATNGVDTSKPAIPVGPQMLRIVNVKTKRQKFGTNEVLQLICNCNLADTKNDLFRDLIYSFTLMSDNEEHVKMGKSMLIGFLERAFKYILKPVADENELVSQIEALKNQDFQAVVREREYLSKTKDEANPWKINLATEIWYTEHASAEMNFDPGKLRKELSTADKAKYAAGANAAKVNPVAAFGEEKAEEPAQVSTSESKAPGEVDVKTPGEIDDLPF